MLIKQISVFIENQSGPLAEVCEILHQNEIDIIALSLADTSDFGILRLIVDKPELTQSTLREQGFITKSADVLAVSMADKPGGLSSILQTLNKENISIDYMYAFVGKQDGSAVVVFSLSDLEKALLVLKEDNRTIINPRDIYSL